MGNAMALVAWDWLLVVIRAENYSAIVAAEDYFLYSRALPSVQVVVGCWLYYPVEYVVVTQVDLPSSTLR